MAETEWAAYVVVFRFNVPGQRELERFDWGAEFALLYAVEPRSLFSSGDRSSGSTSSAAVKRSTHESIECCEFMLDTERLFLDIVVVDELAPMEVSGRLRRCR